MKKKEEEIIVYSGRCPSCRHERSRLIFDTETDEFWCTYCKLRMNSELIDDGEMDNNI